MKALMLGDLVTFGTRINRVDGISVGGFSVYLDKDGWRSISDINPITLTPEILEKNGFKNVQSFSELWCGEWQILCDCEHLAMKHGTGWSADIQCNYIHELQHALRLCGIEKEIEL